MKKPKERLAGTTTVRQDDHVIAADATAGPITVTLPLAEMMRRGKKFLIYKKDSSGNAVTIAAPETYTLQEPKMVKTTIDMPEQMWRDFSVKVIQRHGGRKKNDVIKELIQRYLKE